jgi:hypothetical protein
MAPAVAKGFAADRVPLRPDCFALSLEMWIRPGEPASQRFAMLGFGVPGQASKDC